MSRTYDFEPLCRSGIGFDRLFNILGPAMRGRNLTKYPPYNIERCGENGYRLTLAVAGWTADEIAVMFEPNLLVVSGEKAEPDDIHFLYRGIPTAPFEQRWVLSDDIQVRAAHLADGLLTIDLVHEVPEALEARHVRIPGSAGSQGMERRKAA